MTPIIAIDAVDLVLCFAFVLIAGITSIALELDLARDLLVGTVRCYAQLFLMGYVLDFVFATRTSGLTIGVFLVMVAAAAQVIRGRVGKHGVPFVVPVFLSMLISYALVSFLVVAVIVGARPWWEPMYAIPLAGMIVGNSMNAISISLERLFSELDSRRNEVEMRLALGASANEASQGIVRTAVKAGMIPAINSLMGVGLVFLPGMMTGQILAGVDPQTAIRYQIVVMLMLVTSTCLGALITTLIVRRRCFSTAQALIIR